MAPITHKRDPDASMPRCRNLYAFLGKRCLADQTQQHHHPPPQVPSQKQLGKRIGSSPDLPSAADPLSISSQISIRELLSRPPSKDKPSEQSLDNGVQVLTADVQNDPSQQSLGNGVQVLTVGAEDALSEQSFGNGVQVLTAGAEGDSSEQSLGNSAQVLTTGSPGKNVQLGGDNPKKASSCRVPVFDASLPSEDSPYVEILVSRSAPEQRPMAQNQKIKHKQLVDDEVAELDSVQSTPVNCAHVEDYKLLANPESWLSDCKEINKEISTVPDELCAFKLRGSQDEALDLNLQGYVSSFQNKDLHMMDHSHLHVTFEAVDVKACKDDSIAPSIAQNEQVQSHTQQEFMQSRVEERSGDNLGTCREPRTSNTNSEELQSVGCTATLSGFKTDSSAGKLDTTITQADVFTTSTAQKHVQGCKVDKSLLTCQNKQGQIAEGDLRRSSRIKKLATTGGDEDPAFQTVSTKSCENQQEHSELVVPSSLHENLLKLTRSDFFLPASKRSKKQKVLEETTGQVSEKPVFREKRSRDEKAILAQKAIAGISSKQASSNDDFFKPVSKKQKQIVDTKVNGRLEYMAKEEKGERTSAFAFDLWTEAKIAAEENAQLCVGKPTHPFFSQLKSGHRASLFVSLPANACFFQQVSSVEEMELTPLAPLHVTQLPEAEIHTKDKERSAPLWIFQKLKGDLASTEREISDANRQTLNALLRIPMVKKLFKAPMHRRDDPYRGMSLDKVLEPLLTFLKDLEIDSKENVDQDTTDLSYLEDRLKVCLSDRAKRCSEVSSDLVSAWADEANTQKNMLWTDVYQPQSPQQVCGNRDSVKFLNAWLEKWQAGNLFTTGFAERDTTCRKISTTTADSDDDDGCFQEDSDSEGNIKEDAFSQNVLFMAGPVGCGKTAAIYACARAHGYTVIEVNCSENRNGLLIKQKFSESMESHRLGNKWSADITGPAIISSCSTRNSFIVTDSKVAENVQQTGKQKGRNQNQKHKPKSDPTSTLKLAKNKEVNTTDGGSDSQAEQQDNFKECDKSLTVLLFEDVDMVFEDDRGFLAAVAQLAATAKRPIILTSNDKRLCLPQKLGADMLEFKRPSTKELVILTYLICIAEAIPCRPDILLQMVKLCHNDLRLLLNHLQFWFQGHDSDSSFVLNDEKPSAMLDTELEMQSTLKSASQSTLESPKAEPAAFTKLFELEGQHRLWPLCVSKEFVCPLTQSVAGKVNAKVLQLEREADLEEEKKLEHLILEKLALDKKMKRQKVDTPQKAERHDVSNDIKESTAEESDSWETPVKNLKDAKTLARSPALREKLKKDLASTMFSSAANMDPPDENHCPVLMTPDCREGGPSIIPAGANILDNTVSTITPFLITTSKAAGPPGLEPIEHEVDREFQVFDTNIKTGSMAPTVLSKTSDEACNPNTPDYACTLNTQPDENLRNKAGDSKLQKISQSINNFWSEYRGIKGMQGLLLSSSCESYSSIVAVSKLSENLSICDLMSRSLFTEKMENHSYPSSCCESLENNIKLQACSMVAQKSLLLCAEDCWASSSIHEEGKIMPSIEDMMLALNDPCALARLVSNGELPFSSRGFKLHNIAPSSQEQESQRHLKLSFLQSALYRELPSKMQSSLQRASFFEDASFLARIGTLEQERLTSGGTRRRGRGFHNYFRTHPWNLSKETINRIEQFGKFGSSP